MNTAKLQVRVARKEQVALDTCTYELVAESGHSLPAFSAGSHIDVFLPNGITRQYSLCNNPAERDRYLIGVLRDPESRGGSRAMHDEVNPGDTLSISVPKNHFPLAHGAKLNLLFAGGIGITPILCMAERLAIAGEAFQLHYSARSMDRMAFRDRIEASSFADRSRFYFDNDSASGPVDLAEVLAASQEGAHVYVCGPQGFIEAVLGTARCLGWPEAQLHCEFFGASPVKTESEASFEVQLASSGRVVTVPKDMSVIRALEKAGVSIMTSCEQGVCGTCLTRVIEGEPDHRDMFLSPDEHARNDQFLPCCSRSKSARLVLDL
jgi:vanillate O-demethylase ferredoxin subunit